MTHLYTSSSDNYPHPPPPPPSCSTTMSCLSSPPGDHRSITSRPKLTLQTTSLPRTFGSSTTGLSLSFAAGTASPTVRNTFKNAYDVASPASATTSPSSKAPPSLRFNSNKPISPYVHHANNNPNSFSYRSPYQLPLGVRSILRNSPLESTSRRRSGSISAGTSGPGGAGARRVFFPAKKQVSYRNPLEEEIRTERYTAQHLDLFQDEETIEAVHGEADPVPEEPTPESAEDDDSDSGSLLSLSETSSASSDDVSPNDGGANTTLSQTERKKRRTMRAERQVRAVALLDGFDTDPYASSTPQTPRQGRVKRRREWKWTLGPVSAISDHVHPEVPMQILAPQPVDPPPEKPLGK